MLLNLDNIEIECINGIDSRDHPDYVDAYISAAYWRDSGVPLTNAELDLLNSSREYSSWIYEELLRYLY